jgi:hypothetical protein
LYSWYCILLTKTISDPQKALNVSSAHFIAGFARAIAFHGDDWPGRIGSNSIKALSDVMMLYVPAVRSR